MEAGEIRLHTNTPRPASDLTEAGLVQGHPRGQHQGGIGTAFSRRKKWASHAEIVRKLNTEINAVLADPALKARFADLGGTVLAGAPADFGKLVAEETEKWAKVIRAANIKAFPADP
jgi:hypothetical protein